MGGVLFFGRKQQVGEMKRRDFLFAIALAGPASHALAEQRPILKRLAVLDPTMKTSEIRIGGDPNYTIMFEELKRLGYVEGVNLIVDRYSAEGRFDRYPALAKAIVATRPNVISTYGSIRELLSETRTIPIVAWVGDPIAQGIVSSLAHPGGNVTGVSNDAGADMGAKRIELFSQAVGKFTNISLLGGQANSESYAAKSIRQACEKLNISCRSELLQAPIDEAEYRQAFDRMKRDHVDGVAIIASGVQYAYRVLAGKLAREYRLPAISWYADSVDAGALMSYAFDLKAGTRRVAAQIVEILDGGNPAEMPFFLESHWELVINLKVAKELGLELSPEVVAQADRVIE
jgi:putative ABC transport system substrate-binding protein